MSRLFKWIFNLYQFYRIFFGFSYAYIDLEKRIVKFNIFVKIYVTFVNIICAAMLIYYIKSNSEDILRTIANASGLIVWDTLIESICCLFIVIGLIVLRIKEEKAFKELYLSHINYINEIPNMATDKIAERIIIFYILIFFTHGIYILYRFFLLTISGKWIKWIEYDTMKLFIAIQNNIMFQHCLILSYINNLYSKLNVQLENGDNVQGTFSHIYVQLSLLVEHVNAINGPMIFVIFLFQIIYLATSIRIIYHEGLLMDNDMFLDPSILGFTFLISINLFLYFLICDRFYSTTCKTGDILKEYNIKNHNSEVFYLIK